MIEFLSAYIKTIVSLLLVSVFAEILMPEGGYKKYLKLLTGLIITLTVLKPVTYVFGLSEDRISGAVERKTEEIWGSGLDFSVPDNAETLELEVYHQRISSLIKDDIAKMGLQADNVEVTVEEDISDSLYGNIIDIKAYISEEKGANDKKAADYISGKYSVARKNIEFIYQ